MWILKKRYKLTVLLLGIILGLIKATDADLLVRKAIEANFYRASTLDFSNRQTANEFNTSSLFNVSGMLPGGFQVESIRLKLDGELGHNINFRYIKTGGDDGLCSAIKLKVLKNWNSKYYNLLKDFTYNDTFEDRSYVDYILAVELAEEFYSNTDIANKSCQFNIEINLNEEGSNFNDQEILESRIDTGTWN